MSAEPPERARLFATELWQERGAEYPPSESSAAIGLPGSVVLELTIQSGSSVLLRSPLAGVDQPLSERIWQRLLEGNFLWGESEGSVLGVDYGLPLLIRPLDLRHLTYEAFHLIVEEFVNTAAGWSQICLQLEDDNVSATSSSMAPFGDAIGRAEPDSIHF